MRCWNCGSENPAGKRFCGDCGTSLTASPPTLSEKTGGILPGERRHLTVLFCDLVNSTAIATQLDPEEWREIVGSYHRATAEAITRFGGHVAQYLGDGVMACFGWPTAHENAAESAARAGLAIVEQIATLSKDLGQAKLSARVGIDSGAVVIGAGAGKDSDIFGDVPNIAARTQTAAEPDTVFVTRTTQRLISGLFVVEDRGAQSFKGIERPIQLYRLVRPSGVRGRLAAAAASHDLTGFVGREDELRLLMDRWEMVRRGEGQVITITGEAGVGKSRLVRRFREQIREKHTWVEAAAQPFFQNTQFYQVGDLIKQYLTVISAGTPDANLARLEWALETSGLKLAEAIPLIAPLLNIAIPRKYSPLMIPSEEQRRRLLSMMVEWVIGVARSWRSPLAIVTEDLQWADPSTLELFALLAQQQVNSRLLLLYTARPEFPVPWRLFPNHTHIALHPLSAGDARSLIAEIVAQNSLADETIDTVIERSGGVPLFVEELTRAMLEGGSAQLKTCDIPVTLHDSLMSRLDRLGSAKEIAQIGAVIGSEFSHNLLRAVHPIPEAELQRGVHALAASDLLHVRGVAPDATYKFRHALIRDTAYEALLKSRRRELHTRIAQTIEQSFCEQSASHPELLAHHYTEAGLIAPAVRYWRKAGQKASERSANVEAIAQLRNGLELLKTLPPTSERVIEEVKLQIALTTPISATRGYLDPEVENACKRALDLSREVGETPQLFSVLGALNSIYFNRGEFEVAFELGRRMLRLADAQRDQVLLLWAHYSLGVSFAAQGVLKSARGHLERSIALYDPRKGGTYGFVQDPGPTAMVLLAHVIYKLGYPDQAMERVRQGVALVRGLSHQFTVAWVLGFAGELYWRRGNKLAAQELWEEMAALSNQQGFKLMIAKSSVFLGFALVDQGRGDDGLKKMHEGLYSLIDALPMDEKVHGFGFFALALGRSGRVDEGLSKIDEALRLANQGKTFKDVFLLQLVRGQLFLMKNAAALRKAKQCFSTALELARKQKAKSDELRAAIPLAKLLIQQDRREQAHEMLAKIYNWFTEGFDTADLKDAKALLDELST